MPSIAVVVAVAAAAADDDDVKYKELKSADMIFRHRRGDRGHLPPKIREKYFFRAKIMKNSGILLIFFGHISCKIREFCYFFMHIFSGKNVLPPKLTELLRLYISSTFALLQNTFAFILQQCFIFYSGYFYYVSQKEKLKGRRAGPGK